MIENKCDAFCFDFLPSASPRKSDYSKSNISRPKLGTLTTPIAGVAERRIHARVDPTAFGVCVPASRPADAGVPLPSRYVSRPPSAFEIREMATRRSARARGPAADVEMPAAEPEPAEATDPFEGPSHKSILKKTPSARGPTPPVEHEDEDHFDALFGALMPADATVALVVADWRAKHAADPEAALAELYTLIARVSSKYFRPDTQGTNSKSQMRLKSQVGQSAFSKESAHVMSHTLGTLTVECLISRVYPTNACINPKT